MSNSQEVAGGCLCGAVRFSVRLPSLACVHCHCSMCRRNHGAGYVTWFAVPPERLAVTRGTEALVRYPSSEHGSRSFCRRCGSSLFCENAQHPDRVDIPLGAMDAPIDRAPQVHIHVDSRAEWVAIGDRLPRLGGKTGLEPQAGSARAERKG
jgi:hypothetical protein